MRFKIPWTGTETALEGTRDARTSKETSQLLLLVSMAHAVQKPCVLVRLHACLHTIERECRHRRQDTRSTGGDLGAVALDEALLPRGALVLLILIPIFLSPPISIPAAVLRHSRRRLQFDTILDVGLLGRRCHLFPRQLGCWPFSAAAFRQWSRRSPRPESSMRSRYGQLPAREGP